LVFMKLAFDKTQNEGGFANSRFTKQNQLNEQRKIKFLKNLKMMTFEPVRLNWMELIVSKMK